MRRAPLMTRLARLLIVVLLGWPLLLAALPLWLLIAAAWIERRATGETTFVDVFELAMRAADGRSDDRC